MTYCGWKNYPTWAVFSYVANDEVLYRAALDAARQGCEQLRDLLREDLLAAIDGKGCRSEITAYLLEDLVDYVLREVDWAEVAKALLVDLEGGA